MTISELTQAYKDGTTTVREFVTDMLVTIDTINPDINAYLEIFDDCLEQADRADVMIKEGTATVLTGVPIAIKDNILIKGKKASAGSKMLENYTATYDASAIATLKAMGAILVGRTNMDEFAMGSSTEYSAYGMTRNPLDPTRVPGGSSGGSAAALAMGGAVVSLGTDTAGSVRQPAGFCGLVGLYPTYGSVSRYGIMAMGSSLDQIGPMTQSVDDCEVMFNALSTYDKRDGRSVPDDIRSIEAPKGLKKRLGVPRNFIEKAQVDPEVMQDFERTLEGLRDEGYEIVEIVLPNAYLSLPAYYVIVPAEVSTNLARFDGVRYGHRSADVTELWDVYEKSRGEGFGAEVKRRILVGTYVLSSGYYDAYYAQAERVRAAIIHEFEKVFEDVDAIVTPTSPTTAFEIGAKRDPVSMYAADFFTVPANITGMPALSVPTGTGSNDLPMSFQAIGPRFSERNLFTIGRDVEKIFRR